MSKSQASQVRRTMSRAAPYYDWHAVIAGQVKPIYIRTTKRSLNRICRAIKLRDSRKKSRGSPASQHAHARAGGGGPSGAKLGSSDEGGASATPKKSSTECERRARPIYLVLCGAGTDLTRSNNTSRPEVPRKARRIKGMIFQYVFRARGIPDAGQYRFRSGRTGPPRRRGAGKSGCLPKLESFYVSAATVACDAEAATRRGRQLGLIGGCWAGRLHRHRRHACALKIAGTIACAAEAEFRQRGRSFRPPRL